MRIDPDESYAIFAGPIFREADKQVPIPLSLRTAEIIKIENLACIDDPDGKKFIMDLSFPNGDEENLEISQLADRRNFVTKTGLEFISEKDQKHPLEGVDIEKEFKFLI